MKVTILTPTITVVNEASPEEVSKLKELSKFKNTSIGYLIRQHQAKAWLKKNKPDVWNAINRDLASKYEGTTLTEYNGKLLLKTGFLPYLEGLKVEVLDNKIVYPEPKEIPFKKPLPFELYPYQKESVEKLIKEKHGNVELATGCHAKGQGILMFDGTVKKVEEIVVGDKLMGPDSKPRVVQFLTNGNDEMFRITPVKGEPFVVNKEHILSLQRTNTKKEYRENPNKKRRPNFKGTNNIVNISVKDYLAQSKAEKHKQKLYRVSVDFEKKEESLEIDPYILGVWLGDGSKIGSAVTSMDSEISQAWFDDAKKRGLFFYETKKENNKASNFTMTKRKTNLSVNSFNESLKKLGIFKNKRIPKKYLTASKEVRWAVFAGLTDTDGSCDNKCVEISQKIEGLSKDIVFLARSLGLYVNCKKTYKTCQTGSGGYYFRMTFSGDFFESKTKLTRKQIGKRLQIKSVLRTGFRVESVGEGEYFGFGVDCDHLYLMEDFTVTHNCGKSIIVLNLIKKMGLKTLVIVPSKVLFIDMVDNCVDFFGADNVGFLGDGKKKLGRQITVCISKSLTMLKKDTPEWKEIESSQSMIVDETHLFGAESLEDVCHGVLKMIPYRFFMTGTLTRGDGTIRILQGIVGKTVLEMDTKEGIEKGYLGKFDMNIVKTFSPINATYKDPGKSRRVHFLNNKEIARNVAKICHSYAQRDESVLVFVDELSQIPLLTKLLTCSYGYIHGNTTNKEDQEAYGIEKCDIKKTIEDFNTGKIKVLITTSVGFTGVNFFSQNSSVFWVGSSSEIEIKQAIIGRNVRILAKSKYAKYHKPREIIHLYDFEVEQNLSSLKKRVLVYKSTGQPIYKLTSDEL